MTHVATMLVVGVAALAAGHLAGAAQGEPPEVPSIAGTPSTLRQPPATTTLVLGGHFIRLEETTLQAVVLVVGAGHVERRGDAGDRVSWVCYQLPHDLRLWLISSELGGHEGFISSWHVLRRQGHGDAQCPKLRVNLRVAAQGPKGIWIGAPSSRLEAMPEAPSAQEAGWRIYSYTGRAAKEGFVQLTIFGVHLSDDRVDQLFASQATTN